MTEELVYIDLINEGAYGRVFRAFDKKVNRQVAVKERKFTDEEKLYGMPPDMMIEVVLLLQFNNEHIVRPIRTIIDTEQFMYSVVLEYFERDLHGLISAHKANKQQVPVALAKSIVLQILRGLHYLHSRLVVHRDIKPSNILVNGNARVKITDFGFAKQVGIPFPELHTKVGTLSYRAPELLVAAKMEYGPSVDVWSVGCIMFNLLTLEPFMDEQDEQATLRRLVKFLGKDRFSGHEMYKPYMEKGVKTKKTDKVPKLADLKDSFGDTAFELLTKMLEPVPADRIEAVEAIGHPWFADVNVN